MSARPSTPAPVSVPSPLPDFDALYAEHLPFVWRCLRGLGVSIDVVDDAVQEVFLVVHRRLPDFRGESNVRTWIYGIVRNVAANRRRSERRRPHLRPLQPQLVSSAPLPDERAQEQEAAAFVLQFVATLDDAKRELFVLALLEDMSIPEVAAALGIPLNTAYSRLRSVRLEFQRAAAHKLRRP